MRQIFRIFFTAAIAICASAESHATLVKWTLDDITFDDGGKATGYFTIDTANFSSPDWNIRGRVTSYTSQPTPMFPGETNFKPDVHSIDAHASGQAELKIVFDADLLHAKQGTYPIISGFETETGCSVPRCVDFRADITGGTVTAAVVPEPSTLAFVCLAVGLLVMMRSTQLSTCSEQTSPSPADRVRS